MTKDDGEITKLMNSEQKLNSDEKTKQISFRQKAGGSALELKTEKIPFWFKKIKSTLFFVFSSVIFVSMILVVSVLFVPEKTHPLPTYLIQWNPSFGKWIQLIPKEQQELKKYFKPELVFSTFVGEKKLDIQLALHQSQPVFIFQSNLLKEENMIFSFSAKTEELIGEFGFRLETPLTLSSRWTVKPLSLLFSKSQLSPGLYHVEIKEEKTKSVLYQNQIEYRGELGDLFPLQLSDHRTLVERKKLMESFTLQSLQTTLKVALHQIHSLQNSPEKNIKKTDDLFLQFTKRLEDLWVNLEQNPIILPQARFFSDPFFQWNQIFSEWKSIHISFREWANQPATTRKDTFELVQEKLKDLYQKNESFGDELQKILPESMPK